MARKNKDSCCCGMDMCPCIEAGTECHAECDCNSKAKQDVKKKAKEALSTIRTARYDLYKVAEDYEPFDISVEELAKKVREVRDSGMDIDYKIKLLVSILGSYTGVEMLPIMKEFETKNPPKGPFEASLISRLESFGKKKKKKKPEDSSPAAAKAKEIADAIRRDNKDISDEAAYRMAWETVCSYTHKDHPKCTQKGKSKRKSPKKDR